MRKKRHDDAKFWLSIGATCLFDACLHPARLSGWIAHGAAGQRAAGQVREVVRTGKAGKNDRLNVYRAYQDNMRSVEEDISRVNRMMADGSGDHRALVDTLVGIVERLVNVKIRRRSE